MIKQINYKNISLLSVFAIIILSIFALIPRLYINLYEQWQSLFVYLVLSLLPIVLIGILATRAITKDDTKSIHSKTKSLIFVWVCLIIIFTLILLGSSHKSQDYLWFLDVWTNYYKNHSIKDSLYSIIDVTNYAPAYNYILIIISRIPLYNLHLIKYVSFLFSILLAFAIAKIVAKLRNSNFSFELFVLCLLFPWVLIEYCSWAQCDAIYTSFALLSFYFSLNKNSKLSFLFVGFAFIFKLQFLFIVPILFVMLIIKTETGEHYLKWKDAWIPFAVYLINCIPVVAGRSLLDMLLVYVNQSVNDTRICGECANICLLYYKFLNVRPDTVAHVVLLWVHVAVTFIVLFFYLYIIFKNNAKKPFTLYDITFWAYAFSLSMVFLMPKMLDRFYFIASCLIIILMFSYFEKITCIMGVLTTVFFSLTILNAVYEFTILGFAIAMLIVSFINFGYLVYAIISKYVKNKEYKTLQN